MPATPQPLYRVGQTAAYLRNSDGQTVTGAIIAIVHRDSAQWPKRGRREELARPSPWAYRLRIPRIFGGYRTVAEDRLTLLEN